MPANNSSGLVHWLAGVAPGSIGQLYTPRSTRSPRSWLPYALDNGAFILATKDQDFEWEEWWGCLDKMGKHQQPPLWAVCPDKPFDGLRTCRFWEEWAGECRQRTDAPLALAVQDGMTPKAVKAFDRQPDVIFIGGTTDWKMATITDWCSAFPRVHVARINGRKGLDICHKYGAESCDGSGWFRGDINQLQAMVQFIADHHGLDDKMCHEAVMSTRLVRERQGCLL